MANYMKPKRRSFVAGVISFIGSLVFVWGLYHILSAVYIIVTTDEKATGKIILGILIVILCFAIQYMAHLYDKYREHRKWKKRLKNAGIEDELAANYELCWQAYRSNPTPFGLKYIEEKNPKAAEDIRAYLAENPSNFFEKLMSRNVHTEAVKVFPKEEPEQQKTVIETEQNWADGETIIR
ncbi:MAG: hypothetical protein IJ017_06435 [Oscillospiraceae bacterium]|nr:hypothetical protein [Oscillospiraceae bacterium]